MKVCVTGGTGFVGRAIVKELAHQGHHPQLLVRNADTPAARELATRFGASLSPGNTADAGSINRAMEGADAVIHLVGIISEVGTQTFAAMHRQATATVVEAALTGGIKRYLHMSALGTRPNAVSRYHQTKWEAEQTVRTSELDWTIFRPSLIYGPDDQFVNQFLRISRFSPFLPVIGTGLNKLQPIPVESVAKAFVTALATPESVQQTYDLCGPEALSFNEVIRQILRAGHRRRALLHLPLWLVKPAAALLEIVMGRLLRLAPPLNRAQIQMLQEDNTGYPKPADDLFGLEQLSFRKGLRRFQC